MDKDCIGCKYRGVVDNHELLLNLSQYWGCCTNEQAKKEWRKKRTDVPKYATPSCLTARTYACTGMDKPKYKQVQS